MIRRTKFVEPYKKVKKKNGETLYKNNIPGLKRKVRQTGVYVIKSKKTGEIIYVGCSWKNGGQLYKTIFRHFQTWNDNEQERAVYDKNKYLIKVIYCPGKNALILERYFIRVFKPRDNSLKYGGELYNELEKDRAKEIIYTANEEPPF